MLSGKLLGVSQDAVRAVRDKFAAINDLTGLPLGALGTVRREGRTTKP